MKAPNYFRVDFKKRNNALGLRNDGGVQAWAHPRTYQQHVPDTQLSRPVPLEHVDADFTVGAHIWMEDLGQEVALGWGGGKVLP